MSNSPRTDAIDARLGGFEAMRELCRQLERDLAEAIRVRDNIAQSLVEQINGAVDLVLEENDLRTMLAKLVAGA